MCVHRLKQISNTINSWQIKWRFYDTHIWIKGLYKIDLILFEIELTNIIFYDYSTDIINILKTESQYGKKIYCSNQGRRAPKCKRVFLVCLISLKQIIRDKTYLATTTQTEYKQKFKQIWVNLVLLVSMIIQISRRMKTSCVTKNQAINV